MSDHGDDADGGLRALSEAECLGLLRRHNVGRLGFVVDGRPEVLPVNYASERNGTILFCTSGSSPLSHIDGQPVVFEVDGIDVQSHQGWSVCVHGTAAELDPLAQPITDRIRFRRVSTWAPGLRDRWFEVVPAEITGRRIPSWHEMGGWIAGVVG
jgi:nitroimidazol reductase NimA-like FMN-containing flavoprotein (pyridoxamine 5'-phosphate oxidase superfamily)